LEARHGSRRWGHNTRQHICGPKRRKLPFNDASVTDGRARSVRRGRQRSARSWRLGRSWHVGCFLQVMGLELAQKWLLRAGFACPMASFMARAGVQGTFCTSDNCASAGLRCSTPQGRSYAGMVVRRSWEVGTPRCGVRSAQRADPTSPFAAVTDALCRRVVIPTLRGSP